MLTRPSNTTEQLNGISAQQLSSMLATEFQRHNEGVYSGIDALASQISVVDEKVQPVAGLVDRVCNIEARVSALENNHAAAPPPAIDIQSIAVEIQDRLLRSQNILLYGVAEVNAPSQQTEIEIVTSILSRVPGIDISNITIRRLGKPRTDGSARPLLIKLISAAEVRRVLRNRHVLPRGVMDSSDKTTAERDFLKSIIDQVNSHNASNPVIKKKIKYINGVPTIVDDTQQPHRQKN